MSYVPETVPTTPQELPAFLMRELARISAAFTLLTIGYVEETFVAPTKPRTGMFKLADGTRWNPGLGRGVYYYDKNDSSWHKL